MLGCGLAHGAHGVGLEHLYATLNPHLSRAFEGGVPKVSVFWIDGEDYLQNRSPN
jgi:hypothetical protein